MAKNVTTQQTPAGWRVAINVDARTVTPDDARRLAEEILAAAAKAERGELAQANHHLVRFSC